MEVPALFGFVKPENQMFSAFFEVSEDFWKILLLDVWFPGICISFRLKSCDDEYFKCFWSQRLHLDVHHIRFFRLSKGEKKSQHNRRT